MTVFTIGRGSEIPVDGRQEIFDIAVALIESVIEPDCVTDDIWRESMTLVGIHDPIIDQGS